MASRQPIVEMLIPSTLDDSLAPPGRHVASLFCQHVAPEAFPRISQRLIRTITARKWPIYD
jgi:phytoene dehydrogenase-like protein